MKLLLKEVKPFKQIGIKYLTMKDEKYIKEMQELENEAPTLFGLPKRNNFKVPEGYFDRLPGEVMAKIAEEPPAGYMEQINKWLAKPQMALAALTLLIGISAILYLNDAKNINTGNNITEITNTEIDLFAAVYSEEDMLIENLLAYNDDMNLEYDIFTDEAIEDYLADTEYYLIDYWTEL